MELPVFKSLQSTKINPFSNLQDSKKYHAGNNCPAFKQLFEAEIEHKNSWFYLLLAADRVGGGVIECYIYCLAVITSHIHYQGYRLSISHLYSACYYFFKVKSERNFKFYWKMFNFWGKNLIGLKTNWLLF